MTIEMLFQVFGLNACIGGEKYHKITLSLNYLGFTIVRYVFDSCHI